MNLKRLAVVGCVLLFGTVAFAQDYPKVEVPIDYSYMRFNPENSNIVSGFSLNGGGGGIVVNVNHWFGIEGDFEGYATAGTKVFSFTGSTSLCPTGCTVSANGNLFTYNVGPVIKLHSGRVEPFVETLFGGSHSNVYGNLFKACQLTCGEGSAAPSNNAWDFMIGGGLDLPIGHSVAIRVAQFDYVLTRFQSAFTTSNQNQSNFRYQAGIVLRF